MQNSGKHSIKIEIKKIEVQKKANSSPPSAWVRLNLAPSSTAAPQQTTPTHAVTAGQASEIQARAMMYLY
jgi:hypothetical protein